MINRKNLVKNRFFILLIFKNVTVDDLGPIKAFYRIWFGKNLENLEDGMSWIARTEPFGNLEVQKSS